MATRAAIRAKGGDTMSWTSSNGGPWGLAEKKVGVEGTLSPILSVMRVMNFVQD